MPVDTGAVIDTWAGSREIVLVDDETRAREELAKYLKRQNFDVRQIGGGGDAVSFSKTGQVGVLLMDIEMAEGDLDGIDAACLIQAGHPHSSVIFVTAHYGNPNYRQRVADAGLRVGGWIEKPIADHLDELLDVIKKEMAKVWMRMSMALAEIAPTLQKEVVQELLEEQRNANARNNPLARIDGDAMDRDAEIEKLYAEIRDLIVRSASDPSLKDQIEPLRSRLRQMQEEEAAEVEQYFDARLHLKPGTGYQVLEEAKRLRGR